MILKQNKLLPQTKVHVDGGVYGVQRSVLGNRYKNPYEGQTMTPYKLVLLLSSLHQQKKMVLRNPIPAYLRGATQLLTVYGETEAVKILLLSAEYSTYPWSFSFVLRLADDCSIKCEKTTIRQLIEGICT